MKTLALFSIIFVQSLAYGGYPDERDRFDTPKIEVLSRYSIGQDLTFIFSVNSGHCTNKDFFTIKLNEISVEPAEIYTPSIGFGQETLPMLGVTLLRTHKDNCKGLPQTIDIAFTFAELKELATEQGIQFSTLTQVLNPLMRGFRRAH